MKSVSSGTRRCAGTLAAAWSGEPWREGSTSMQRAMPRGIAAAPASKRKAQCKRGSSVYSCAPSQCRNTEGSHVARRQRTSGGRITLGQPVASTDQIACVRAKSSGIARYLYQKRRPAPGAGQSIRIHHLPHSAKTSSVSRAARGREEPAVSGPNNPGWHLARLIRSHMCARDVQRDRSVPVPTSRGRHQAVGAEHTYASFAPLGEDIER